MISVHSVLYTLVLLSELSSHWVTIAVPVAPVEDSNRTEQDDLGLILGDEAMPDNAPPLLYRRSLRDEDGNPKILIVSDVNLKGLRQLSSGFVRTLPLLADRRLGHAPAEHSLKIDRRNADLDILRCMIGRVYRPCWEAQP